MSAGSARQNSPTFEHGRCVICGVEGTSRHDFICTECGDPLAVTLFCRRCERRLVLDADAASAFLSDHGYQIDDMEGLVLKVTACSRCMKDDERSDLHIYRIHFGSEPN